MAILALTDLHLTDKPADDYRHKFMEEHLMGIVRKRKPEAVLILGDLTEEKDRHSARLVNRIAGHIDRLAYECPVLIVMGNHDYANEGFPFFDFVHRFRDVDFVSKPVRAENLPKPFRVPFKGCLFLPHTRRYEDDWLDLQKDFKKFRAVFSHNTYDGAGSGTGRKLKGIPLDLMQGARVFAGDVHHPQTTGPVTYIGAPYTVDFGDDYQPRMLWLNGESVEWIMVHKFPQKVLIHVEEGKDLEDYRKDFNPGDMLKVRVDVDDMKDWRAIADVVQRQAEKFGATARAEPVVHNKTRRKSVQVQPDSRMSDAEIVRNYADRHKLDDATLAVGLKLLED